VILCELIVKCVIGFGRIVRILEDPWKWQKGTIIFNVQQNRVMCRLQDLIFSRPTGLLDSMV
jgi:hypothetical protein